MGFIFGISRELVVNIALGGGRYQIIIYVYIQCDGNGCAVLEQPAVDAISAISSRTVHFLLFTVDRPYSAFSPNETSHPYYTVKADLFVSSSSGPNC